MYTNELGNWEVMDLPPLALLRKGKYSFRDEVYLEGRIEAARKKIIERVGNSAIITFLLLDTQED